MKRLVQACLLALLPVCLNAQRPFKVLISVDMEGITGVVTGEQLGPSGFEYARFREFMTAEALAAVEAAKESGAESVMSAFPPEATPQKERRSAAGTAPAQVPAGPDSTRIAAREAASGDAASRAVGSSGTLSGIAQDATPLAPAVPPVEIKPLPAKPAPKAARRPPVEKTPPSKPAPAPVASAATPAASEPAPVVAAAPKPAPVIDRWTRMSDELSRCTREDFIARVICDQRVRLRYCDGYWGKVAQCPDAQNPNPGR